MAPELSYYHQLKQLPWDWQSKRLDSGKMSRRGGGYLAKRSGVSTAENPALLWFFREAYYP